MPFLTAPTLQQRSQIEMLCNKGLSDNFFDRHIEAPIQAVSALTNAAMDFFKEPLRGCWNSGSCVFKGELIGGVKELFGGVVRATQSLVQLALITTTAVCGILFPRFSYAALQSLNPRTGDASLRAVIDSLTNEKNLSDQNIEELQRLNATQRLQITQYENDLEVQRQALLELETLRESSNQNKSLLSEKQDLEFQLSQLKSQENPLAKTNQDLRDELETLRENSNQNKSLLSEKQDLEFQLSQLKSQENPLAKTNQDLRDELEQLRLKLIEEKQGLNTKMKEWEEQEEAIKSFESKISKMKQEIEEKEKNSSLEISELKEKLQDREKDLADALNLCRESQTTNSKLNTLTQQAAKIKTNKEKTNKDNTKKPSRLSNSRKPTVSKKTNNQMPETK